MNISKFLIGIALGTIVVSTDIYAQTINVPTEKQMMLDSFCSGYADKKTDLHGTKYFQWMQQYYGMVVSTEQQINPNDTVLFEKMNQSYSDGVDAGMNYKHVPACEEKFNSYLEKLNINPNTL